MGFLQNISLTQKLILTILVISIVTAIIVTTRTSSPTPTPPQPTIPKGQFIKITNPTSTNGIMNLSRISILSSPTTLDEYYGGDFVSIATTAKATASSIYGNMPNYYGPSILLLTGRVSGNFASTQDQDKSPFFLLDFGSMQQIGQIYIVNRPDCCFGRATGSVVTIYDSAMNPVWRSDSFKSKSGGVSSTEDMDGYWVYSITPTSAYTRITGVTDNRPTGGALEEKEL